MKLLALTMAAVSGTAHAGTVRREQPEGYTEPVTLNAYDWKTSGCEPGAEFISTKFGQRACELKNRQTKIIADNCLPQLHKPKAGVKARGAVLLLHGYSACPDAMSEVGQLLANEGFYAYTPLIVGHGREKDIDCHHAGIECVEGGWAIDELPTTGKQYDDWIKLVVTDFETDARALNIANPAYGVNGLSVGGALVARAVQISDIFTRALMMNPFLGVSFQDLDRGAVGCQDAACAQQITVGTIQVALQQIGVPGDVAGQYAIPMYGEIAKLPQPFDLVKYSSIWEGMRRVTTKIGNNLDEFYGYGMEHGFETRFGWGAGCEAERRLGRGGFCYFQYRHLSAVNGLADIILKNTDMTRVEQFELIGVERDQYVRNERASHIVRQAGVSGSKIGYCLYPQVTPDCGGNACGVPHAMTSRVEALSAGQMYWADNLYANIVNFMKDGTSVGGDWANGIPERLVCGKPQDIYNPDSKYFGVRAENRDTVVIDTVTAAFDKQTAALYPGTCAANGGTC